MNLESRAAEMATASNSKAACYELARHYEANENMENAIEVVNINSILILIPYI